MPLLDVHSNLKTSLKGLFENHFGTFCLIIEDLTCYINSILTVYLNLQNYFPFFTWNIQIVTFRHHFHTVFKYLHIYRNALTNKIMVKLGIFIWYCWVFNHVRRLMSYIIFWHRNSHQLGGVVFFDSIALLSYFYTVIHILDS